MSDTVKLIIEIPTYMYRARQHWVANPKMVADEVDTAIANGIPLDDVKAEIQKAKRYKGENANPALEKHNIGLDKYFDKGLNMALKILDNIGKESENNK